MTDEKPDPNEIAFVAYPRLTPLDLVGPLQVVTVLTLFSPAYRPVVVAETLDPIHTDGPMKLVADTTFDQVPSPLR